MFKFFLFLSICVCSFAQTRDELRTHLIEHEGYRNAAYKIYGQWHIGIGHKLDDWKPSWSNKKIENVFTADLKIACDTVLRDISNFSKHPKPIRIMLVGLAFNVGPTGFHEFRKFRAAIEAFDYNRAADELSNSLWAIQLPNRANSYISVLR